MGFWEKRESKHISGETDDFYGADTIKSPEIKTGDNIDYAALDELEADMNGVANKIHEDITGIAEDIKKQKQWARDLLSSNYWFAVCFNNETQKRQCLEAMGINPSDTFVYGRDFLRATGIRISEPNHNYSNERKMDSRLSELARDIEE